MALVLKDRVKETTTTTGTGSFALAGAVTGYDSFGQIGSGNTTYYAVYLDGGSEWEVGIGTYTSPSTLSRDTILASSNAGSVVTFSAGQKTIWCDYPAGTSVYASNNGSQTSGQVLKSNGVGTPPTWQTTTNGDVVGPASATDNAVARFDGTTGKLIQNSVTTIDDTGNASGILSQQFSDGTAVTLAAGKFWYNGTTGSWNAGMGGGLVTQQIGEELYRYGKASSAITDSPLQLVYKTGVVGASGVITFAPAIAGITNSDQILGCATEPIALNGFGRVTTYGIVNNITTNGTAYGETWADNDDIYYNPVTGGLTKTIPTAPNLKLLVGTIINAGSGSSGSFIVKFGVATYLSELSDTQISSATGGQLLTYNQTNGYWKNTSLSAGTGISVTPTAGGAITVANTGVTSVTGTAPVVSSGGTTPAISMAQSSTTVDGYLSATDFTTFNSKLTNPMSALGDIIYGASSGTATRLAGNTTTNKYFLSQTGTGSASAVPSWSTLPTVLPVLNRAGSTVSVAVGNGVLPVLNRAGSTVNVAIN